MLPFRLNTFNFVNNVNLLSLEGLQQRLTKEQQRAIRCISMEFTVGVADFVERTKKSALVFAEMFPDVQRLIVDDLSSYDLYIDIDTMDVKRNIASSKRILEKWVQAGAKDGLDSVLRE